MILLLISLAFTHPLSLSLSLSPSFSLSFTTLPCICPALSHLFSHAHPLSLSSILFTSLTFSLLPSLSYLLSPSLSHSHFLLYSHPLPHSPFSSTPPPSTLGLKAIDLAIRNKQDRSKHLLAEYHLHYCTSSDFDSVLFLKTLEVYSTSCYLAVIHSYVLYNILNLQNNCHTLQLWILLLYCIIWLSPNILRCPNMLTLFLRRIWKIFRYAKLDSVL